MRVDKFKILTTSHIILENGITMKDTEEEFKFGMMDLSMRDNGKTAKHVAKED